MSHGIHCFVWIRQPKHSIFTGLPWQIWVMVATASDTYPYCVTQIWADPGKYALMGAAAQLGKSQLLPYLVSGPHLYPAHPF